MTTWDVLVHGSRDWFFIAAGPQPSSPAPAAASPALGPSLLKKVKFLRIFSTCLTIDSRLSPNFFPNFSSNFHWNFTDTFSGQAGRRSFEYRLGVYRALIDECGGNSDFGLGWRLFKIQNLKKAGKSGKNFSKFENMILAGKFTLRPATKLGEAAGSSFL